MNNPPMQDQQQLTIPQALELANQHQTNGRLTEAETLLRKILQVQPENSFALHLLGCIAHQATKPDIAIQLIERAVQLQPTIGLFQSNLAEMYRQAGQTDKAIKAGQRATELDPNYAPGFSNLGIAFYDLKDYQNAEHYQQQALALEPGLVQALNNLGSIYRDQKETDRAIEFYQKALKSNPNHAESLNNLGAVMTENEQPEKGLELLQKALQLQPNYAEAYRNTGSCYLMLEQYSQAQQAFRQALQLKPDFPEALLGLASIEQEGNRFSAAEQLIDQALAINASLIAAYSQQGSLYNTMGFPDRAHQAFDKGMELDPDDIGCYIGKSQLLTEQGEMEAAQSLLNTALSLDSDSLAARLNLAQLNKASVENSNFKALLAAEEKLDPAAKTRAIGVHFGLGKCYDDIGDYQQSMTHFLEACRLKREKIHYKASDNTMIALNIMSTFTPELLARFKGIGCTTNTPIFVLGMPRSGTTLTEQIIASHPLCHGAGELPDLGNIINRREQKLTESAQNNYPNYLPQLNPDEITQMGERYYNSLRKHHAEARHITDKMPSNFFYLGLIHLMLPRAKIIHVKRHPIDTCISGLSKLFKRGQYHSYDMVEQASYYRDYANLMAHWRSILPAGSFYEVQYEDLVRDTESQAKALINYCELEWDDVCLEFYKHKRSVKTASVTQVRKPIYNSSLERWRRYGDVIQPLLDTLGDLVPADR